MHCGHRRAAGASRASGGGTAGARVAGRAAPRQDGPARARPDRGTRARAHGDRQAGERDAVGHRCRRGAIDTAWTTSRGPPAAHDVIAVVGPVDFDAAATQLNDARERGWRIAAAIVEGDDGVLIGNRFDRSLPIVDEVSDARELPLGALAAVEVAPAGATIAVLSDPLRLGLLLGFDPDQARAARTAARAVAGYRAAIIVRTARAANAASGRRYLGPARRRRRCTAAARRARRSSAAGGCGRGPRCGRRPRSAARRRLAVAALAAGGSGLCPPARATARDRARAARSVATAAIW